jgi:hypothetical protein
MCSRIFKIESGTFSCNPKNVNRNQNSLMCSGIFKIESGTFTCNPKTVNQNQKRFDVFQNCLKQKRNFSIKSKIFGTKPKRFDLFQNFLKQFFLQVLLQPLLAFSWPLLASVTLSQPQLTFSGTSSSLAWPLKHLKASTDNLTASKALSRPLQSTSTLLACNREFTRTFSRL